MNDVSGGSSWSLGPTLLFTPADKPERVIGAFDRADRVVIDLEDAVPPAARPAARSALVERSVQIDVTRAVIRVNASGTDDLALDLAAVRASGVTTIMLSKASSAAEVEALAPLDVVALIETPAGVLAAAEIAVASNCVGVMWGSEDLALELHAAGSRVDGVLSGAMQHARHAVLLASRAAGVLAIDAVYPDIADLYGLREEAAEAAFAGFDAKACVHPRQLDIVRDAFRPTSVQLGWARSVAGAAASHEGVFTLEGAMVDAPVIRRAQALLARG